jgi:hypothetical protein
VSGPRTTGAAPTPPAPRGLNPRPAGGIALAAGLAAAIAVLFAPTVSWWMPPLAFALAAIVVWRFLRPSPRRIDVLDEI